MPTNLKISLAQLEFKFKSEEENISKAREAITKASKIGSDLVLLPELWASGFDLKNWGKYASPLNQGIFSLLQRLSKENNIAIGSSLLELKDDQGFNTFVLFGKNGETLGVYRKIHRFRLLEEEKWLGAGDRVVITDTPWGKFGLAICYDLRFPEVFRPYAISGARLVLIVAEWPEKRVDHWTKLLQARAIENQMFFAAVNKVGESKGVKLGGRSAIIDPWGKPILEGDDQPALLTAEIDLLETEKARKAIPVLQDIRFESYKLEGDEIIWAHQ